MFNPVISLNSDAPRRMIYEYHRAEINFTKVTNYSAIEFTPLPSKLSIFIISEIYLKDVLLHHSTLKLLNTLTHSHA